MDQESVLYQVKLFPDGLCSENTTISQIMECAKGMCLDENNNCVNLNE
jgi:hypothetical protein